jgi:antitoxin YefM
MYGNIVHNPRDITKVDSVSVNQFREKLKHCVERVIQEHQPLKVTRRNGEDFVVISAEDWERERETLYVLQNQSLMQQIAESQSTHKSGQGHKPSDEELDEIISI